MIREDIANRDLLFLGSDVGLYVSFNRGGSWQRFMSGFPTVPVHDLRIHPRDRDLIAATHGRSLWIVNIAPLEQLNDSAIAAGAYLFQPTTAYQYGQAPLGGGNNGQKQFRAPSPQYGAEIVYRLATGSSDRRARTQIVIRDVRGDTVRTIQGPAGAGLHRVVWNFQGRTPPPVALSPSQKRDSAWLVMRINVVFDSLAKAGTNAQQLEPIKTALLAGDRQRERRRVGRCSARRDVPHADRQSAASARPGRRWGWRWRVWRARVHRAGVRPRARRWWWFWRVWWRGQPGSDWRLSRHDHRRWQDVDPSPARRAWRSVMADGR